MRKIPKLFELIIKNDKVIEEIHKLPVVNLKLYREAKLRKLEFIRSAENIYSKAKKPDRNGNLK